MQRAYKCIGISLVCLLINPTCFCQGLEKVEPVLVTDAHDKIDPSVSFILTPSQKLEIIDANQPWPPRWFVASMDGDTGYLKVGYSNARMENGYFAFYKEISRIAQDIKSREKSTIVLCDERFKVAGTIEGADSMIDSHDFAINANGEALVTIKVDTLLNLRWLTGNEKDTAVNAQVDKIEILACPKRLLYKWDPVAHLGVEAFFPPYGNLVSLSYKMGSVDWSHANALDWDADGNILYSFRHIGIGKVSRADGHVIWRIDRNKMPYIVGKDTLAFYLAHGFEISADFPDCTAYTLYSNGDSLHPAAYGLEIAVSKRDSAVLSVKKKIPASVISSMRAGNYDILENGDYIINYGGYTPGTDTARQPVFMEYGNSHDKIYAQYRFNSHDVSYAVHPIVAKRPPRPVVKQRNKLLIADGAMKKWTWYQLSGVDNTKVKKVATGETYAPAGPGTYCVAGKYGIGWSVSSPFVYK